MIEFQLQELQGKLSATLTGGDASIHSVSTDSRKLQPGDLFVALHGPSFDGHDYVQAAAERQASAALVSRPVAAPIPCLQVVDTRLALGQLAAQWRDRASARLVAVTGSNGKTTVKEMLAAILGQQGSVLATLGNLNNDIGLPLTLTRLQDEDFAVVELGANHAGEIDYLSRIARPEVAVLNNAGRAHLEGFGSLQGIARAKLEIINGLAKDGVFVFNADDKFADMWRQAASDYRQLTFGVQQPADVSSEPRGMRVKWSEQGFSSEFMVKTPAGDLQLNLQLAGEHNRLNALAAVAAAQVFGADRASIMTGLAQLRPVPGRLCLMRGCQGARLVDDSYNANPDSVSVAIEVLASAPGRRSLVLGDLAELGPEQAALHAEIGEQARPAGIDQLFTCGVLSEAASNRFGRGARHFSGVEQLTDALQQYMGADESVLIKGSRAAAMDKVVACLAAGGSAC